MIGGEFAVGLGQTAGVRASVQPCRRGETPPRRSMGGHNFSGNSLRRKWQALDSTEELKLGGLSLKGARHIITPEWGSNRYQTPRLVD